MLLALVTAHLLLALGAPVFARWWGTRAFLVAAVVPLASFAWLVTLGPEVLRGRQWRQSVPWIPELGVSLDFSIGSVSWVLALVVSGIGTLVLAYCAWYFTPAPATTRALGLLTAFAGVMLGLVTADNLIVLYIFWELTTVFSYLLIGHDPTRRANRSAALTALIVTTSGGLAMLVGIVTLGMLADSFNLSAILADPPRGGVATTAALLMLVGALSKSALVPFHFWLPGAMAAPTPVSAYLHAASMVKAGVYLVAVLAPAFATVPFWRPTVCLLGSATMLVGGWRALRQDDLKLLLAYGTVSQLGFMVLLAGLGTRAAAVAALAMTVTHALFKSGLFLSVGVIDHATGTRDLTRLSGMGRRLPILAAAAGLAAASMAGLPPLLGFLSKEVALEALTYLVPDGGGTGMTAAMGVALISAVVVGSALTVAYSLRFWWGGFADKEGVQTPFHAPGPALQAAPVLLATLSLVGGFLGGPLTGVFSTYAVKLSTGEPSHGLALWHGFTAPLGLSVLAIAGGVALFWRRAWVTRAQATFPRFVPADEWYKRSMRAIDWLGVETTSRTQTGSLAAYTSAIVGVVLLGVGGSLLFASSWPTEIRWFERWGQVAVAIVMVAAALVAAFSRGRVRAVLAVGVTGYGVALLFLLHGAPDLALTQVLVESVTLVVFLLLLRRLPKYFTDRPLHSSRWWRALLAIGLGVTVAGFAVLAAGVRTATPASEQLQTAAKEVGYGTNIVNVILVDTRAWDTLGESAVLVIAATGVASLIFLRSRVQNITRPGRLAPVDGGSVWLRGSQDLGPEARSLVFEVVTRLLFGAMMMVSLWLLLAGHNWPGGGFAGGLVAGMALMVRYLAAGREELNEAAPVDAGKVLGAGLLVAAASALAPLAVGGRVFQSYEAYLDLAALGRVHLVSSTVFDVGVYLVVMGMLLDFARSLGSGIDLHERGNVAPLPLPESTTALTPPRERDR